MLDGLTDASRLPRQIESSGTREATMHCPVCAAPAEDLTPGSYDGVVVRCRRCGDYQVTGTVFDKLLRLSIEQRSAALEAAKRRTTSGARPTISSTCF
jgi:hypothetical protein